MHYMIVNTCQACLLKIAMESASTNIAFAFLPFHCPYVMQIMKPCRWRRKIGIKKKVPVRNDWCPAMHPNHKWPSIFVQVTVRLYSVIVSCSCHQGMSIYPGHSKRTCTDKASRSSAPPRRLCSWNMSKNIGMLPLIQWRTHVRIYNSVVHAKMCAQLLAGKGRH